MSSSTKKSKINVGDLVALDPEAIFYTTHAVRVSRVGLVTSIDDKYYRQYDNVVVELLNNPDSRRASMVYQRPSIWVEYNQNGKNDFICTNAVTYYIRNDELQSVVQMRSNDVVFGYKNDYAWQQYVLKQLAADLDIEPGYIIWQVQNLHVYERHFHLVK